MTLYISFLYTIIVLIWGTSWFGIKMQLGIVAPEVSVVYRFLIASVILGIFCVVTKRRLKFSKRDHVFLVLQGLFQFSLNYQFFYAATQKLPSSWLVSLALSVIVGVNIVNMAIFFHQPIQAKTVIASLIGLTGLTLVFWPEIMKVSATAEIWIGFALSLLGTICASLGTMVAVRHHKVGIPIISSTLWGMMYGTLFSALFVVVKGTPITMDWSARYLSSMMYLSIFATIIGFATYFSLIQKIGADKAAYSSLLYPLVALVISTIYEQYHWSLLVIIGIVLVLAGNVMILYKPRPKQP